MGGNFFHALFWYVCFYLVAQFSIFPFTFIGITKNKNAMKRKMKLLGILVVSAIAILGYAETTHSGV